MLRGLVVISIVLVAGCDDRTCGEGTLRYGDTCVLDDPFDKTAPEITVDPPRYTRQVGTARLTSNKPATIYYTIDGQSPTLDSTHEDDQVVIGGVPDNAELRYFAIDRNGNRTPEQLHVWIIDRDGPGAPLDFALAFNNPSRDVQWTPPPDPRPGGVIVVRVDGLLASPPLPGQSYEVGDTLSAGVTIVAKSGPEVTALSTYTESIAATPGIVRYAAWAFDDLLNYGPPAGDYALIPIPPQAATIHVEAATGMVTVTSPASHTPLSGTATFAVSTNTLTVELSMRNDTTRVLFGPKMVLTSALPGGITWTNSDGMVGVAPLPYRKYGGAIVPASTANATWTFTGATASTTLDLTLDIRNGHVLTASTWDYDSLTAGSIVDAEVGGEVSQLQAAPTGQGGGSMTTQGGFTPDGRVILGNRTSGTVSSFDVQTGARLVTATLRPQKAFTQRVVLDRSGTAVYALVADGHPYNIYQNGGGTTKTELVRLDATTLTISGRLELGNTRTRNMDLSPDGRTLVVSSGITAQGVYIVDLATFTIKTTITTDFRPQIALFAPTIEGEPTVVIVGESVATYRLDGTKVAQYAVTGVGGKVVGAALGGNKVWVARKNELITVDLANGGASAVIPVLTGRSVSIFDGAIYVYGGTGNTLKRIDETGAVLATLTGFYSLDSHWVGRSPF